MKSIIASLLASLCCLCPCLAREVEGDFLNPSLSPQQRTADLLPKMTLEEKAGQLLCPLGWEMWEKKGATVVPSEKFKQLQADCQAGMLWAVYRADPWTRKTIANGLSPQLAAECGNALQRYVIENTRLGIPLFLAEEAPHGHMAVGGTVFPTGIGMAATWNPSLLRQVGAAIGSEIRSQGAHISYGPVLDLAREPRWSRVEETMGEDPCLSGTLGAAIVEGLGGGDLSKPNSTVATLKHFIAYGVPEGGQNGNFSVVGQRDLLQNFLPPFHRAIEAGALSVMTSYNSLDGVPCTSNRSLLTNLLRDDWHFRGITVSDLYAIEGLVGSHRVAASAEEAASLALKAGLDVDLGGDAFRWLVKAVKEGDVSETALNKAVERVLMLKFEMGLFENPYVEPSRAPAIVNSQAHKDLALEVARQSITLLKNDAFTLPLPENIGRVAVVGPNAATPYNQLGDYTAPQPEGFVKTVVQGFQNLLGNNRVIYAKGCSIRQPATKEEINQAVEAARSADAVVAVVGGSSARDFQTEYKETGAAEVSAQSLSDIDCGEGYDRSSLSLLGSQQQLLEALKATGKPLIVVYIEGRPLDKLWAAENADALLTAYYPGQEGGQAIAEAVMGRTNPAGRLPLTVPRSVGQLPNYYNRRAPRLHDYVEETSQPLFPFGFGLSYSQFVYSDLMVTPQDNGDFRVEFTLGNSSERDGEEVSQLYIHRKNCSVVQPLLQLKAFERVPVAAKTQRRVAFTLRHDDFAIINTDYQEIVEPGEVEILVGPSSATLPLKTSITLR